MPDQPLEVNDFSGGITDSYIDCEMNAYKEAYNLTIKPYGKLGKLFSRPGSIINDSSAAGTMRLEDTRTGYLKYFDSSRLLSISGRKLAAQAVAGPNHWAEIVGPVTSNSLYPAGADTTTVTTTATWNRHLFIANSIPNYVSKVYPDGSSVLQLRTAGLPQISSAGITLTPAGGGAAVYLYKFVYKYSYSVGTVSFVDRGSPSATITSPAGVTIAGVGTQMAITVIPVLANGAITNWETTAIKVEVYRTIDTGSVFYYSGEVTNGTVTYNDPVTDANLQLNQLLYTEDGSQPNGIPPKAKVIHVDDNVCYYGNILDGSEQRKNRFFQSIPGDLDSVPPSFYRDLDDEIVAISSFKGNRIVLCNKFIYRVEGVIDVFGRGEMIPTRISDTAGCIAPDSVTQGLEGIFWAGVDGFYWTDGFNVRKITNDLEDRYKERVDSATKKRRIQGRTDILNKRIYWTMTSLLASECDEIWVLHTEWGLKPNSAFTIWRGKSTLTATAIEVILGDLYRGDLHGYIFKHLDTLPNDDKVANGGAYSTWIKEAIIYNFVSFATSFGNNFVRKFAPRITFTAKALSNLSVLITSNNDDGLTRLPLKYIRDRSVTTWGDAEMMWGEPTTLWNRSGLIQEQRRFPAKSLRFAYKQIELTNAFLPIVSSDTMGRVDVNSVAKTVLLNNAATVDWPSQSVDYYIAFEIDSYRREYLITSRSADTLVYSDAANTSTTAVAHGFVLRGVPKNEYLQLLSYTIHWNQFGKTQSPYTVSESGEPG